MNIFKLEKYILKLLAVNSKLTVAVSGGIDSLTLATFISNISNNKLSAAHAVSPAVPKEATNRVKELAKKFDWDLNIINANELNDPRYKANPYNRCFFCKENLYKTIESKIEGLILSGANEDDLTDYRPGLDAAKNANVKHPFIESNFTKHHIRKLAKQIGLKNISDIPSSPCLASRIETGIPISKSLLKNIELTEKFIKEIIPNADVRCRWTNNNINIQFKYPTIENISILNKQKIKKNTSNIFSVNTDKIAFSVYTKGSAFIRKKLA